MWAIKIIAKLILSRLPVSYRFWSKLGLFRHGHMETADYIVDVFSDHAQNAFPEGLPAGFTGLEMGPGDSLASMLVACARGAGKVYLLDAGAFARNDPEFYKSMARLLEEKGLDVPDIQSAQCLEDILKICNAEYLTNGLESLRQIPDQSVDMIWSQAVLEHVRRAEFDQTMAELARILKSRGRASHVIDFKDHLAEALNNLRFSDKLWESDFFTKSGFYTNRIQAPAMLKVFRDCGFKNIEVLKEWRWDKLPTPRSALNAAFKEVSDEDLLINCIKVTMTPPQPNGVSE